LYPIGMADVNVGRREGVGLAVSAGRGDAIRGEARGELVTGYDWC